jgi:CPA2 family monovalent cation:H+ antiporter-2
VAEELMALGGALLVAGLLARGGRRLSLPTIPFFMAAGVLLGPYTWGPVLIEHPESLELVAAIGLILLLFSVGVEFPAEAVLASGWRLFAAAGAYIGLSVGGGLLLGAALGWGGAETLVIAGAVGISSSAIVTKLLIELRRLTNAETPTILGIIVLEDLFLAFYLALQQPILGDADSLGEVAGDFALSFGFVLLLLLVARYGAWLVGAVLGSDDDELLTVLFVGLALGAAGLSAYLGVSDAIGALMIGLVVSQTVLKERIERLVLPLRDAFAAVFFVVFGLSIDVGALGGVIVPVLAAAVLTLVLNMTAGVVTARLHGFNQRAAANVGLGLLGRGEFSLILATLALGAGLDPRIGPFVGLYVLLLAVVSPLLSSRSGSIARLLPSRLLAGWTYVRQHEMTTACSHLGSVRDIEAGSDGCEECLRDGHEWVALRLCLTCGHVGCCDDSAGRHATAHFEATGHPVIRSLEPGAGWRWCYVDQMLVHRPSERVDEASIPETGQR